MDYKLIATYQLLIQTSSVLHAQDQEVPLLTVLWLHLQ